jgi:origin recognition complex subunit 1
MVTGNVGHRASRGETGVALAVKEHTFPERVRLMTTGDLCTGLRGKEIMVFCSTRLQAWYRARVTRFDPDSMTSVLHYPEQGWTETLSRRSWLLLIERQRARMVIGKNEPMSSNVSPPPKHVRRVGGRLSPLVNKNGNKGDSAAPLGANTVCDTPTKTCLVPFDDRIGTPPGHIRGTDCPVRSIVIKGERFEVGNDVLIVKEDHILSTLHHIDQWGHKSLCHECQMGLYDASNNVLLECGKCMRFFHQRCLETPLANVPDTIWICHDCLAGEQVPVNVVPGSLTVGKLYLSQRGVTQKGLALGRIESITENGTGQEGMYSVTCRWFCLPEDTDIGRQSKHTAREVFLTKDKNPVAATAICCRAKVVSLSRFNSSRVVTEDVTFVCDHVYDNDPDSSSEDDESKDPTFHPESVQPERSFTHLGKRRKSQGGDYLARHDGDRVPAAHLSEVNMASATLTSQFVPEHMLCREEQQEHIEAFMRISIASKQGKCMYICGIPGTGKTACLAHVVRDMKGEKVRVVEVNCLLLPAPNAVYSKLYEALTGETVGATAASKALDDIFKQGMHGDHVIVILDEMDSIVTKSQKVLYNLFDWASNPSSNLSIIGVANTMDLTERLQPRIASRLAGNKVVFHPYQKDELQTIVQGRLETFDTLFDNAAIQYVARKVANCSGDLRRCLELCRRGLEIAQTRWKSDEASKQLVSASDIDKAIREAYNSPSAVMLTGCPRDQLMTMAAVSLENRYSSGECTLGCIFSRMNNSFPGYGITLPILLHCVTTLGSCGLILHDEIADTLECKISLNVVEHDLKYALSDNKRSAIEHDVGGRL